MVKNQTQEARSWQRLRQRHRDVASPDEAGDVDVDKRSHEVLAVESVHDAAVTWDGVGKVLRGRKTERGDWSALLSMIEAKPWPCRALYLDLERPLEAAGEEAAEGPHDGGEGGESDAVDLEGIETHCGLWRQGGR